MAPRLSHRKTRTGCKRCKARKVKCDEEKPKCGACSRHNVSCEYGSSPYEQHAPASEEVAKEHMLELRLMQEWMAYTSESLSTIPDYWKLHCPLIAFDNRHVLDAMLALTALFSSRQPSKHWDPVKGKMASADDAHGARNMPSTDATNESGWKVANRERDAISSQQSPTTPSQYQSLSDREDMLEISRRYFSRALEGHQQNVAKISEQNVKSTYLSSLLVCYYALFTLSEKQEESLMLDAMAWFRLSRGTTLIIERWLEMVGTRWFLDAGGMYGEPDLSDNDELFRKEHQQGFEYLLNPVGDDYILDQDREAYEHTLSYIGLIHKGIVHGLDSPLATGRRVIAMPARVPPRFGELVEAHEPRAVAILAHAFGIMKLAEERFSWLRGVAQKQVPILCSELSPAWATLVQWPLQIVRGDTALTMDRSI